jgi:hypothetical protein
MREKKGSGKTAGQDSESVAVPNNKTTPVFVHAASPQKRI